MNERLNNLSIEDIKKAAKNAGRFLVSSTLAFSMGATPVRAESYSFMQKGETRIFDAGCVLEGSVKINGVDTAVDNTDAFSATLTIINKNGINVTANGKVAYGCGDPTNPGEVAATLLDRAQREGCLANVGCSRFYQQEVGASLYADQTAVEMAQQQLSQDKAPVQGKVPLQGKPPVQAPVPIQAPVGKPPVQAPVQAPVPTPQETPSLCPPTMPGMNEGKRDVKYPPGTKITAPPGAMIIGDTEVAPIGALPIGEQNPGYSAHDNLRYTGAILMVGDQPVQIYAKFGWFNAFCPKNELERQTAFQNDLDEIRRLGCGVPEGCKDGVEVYDANNGIPTRRAIY